MRYLASMTRAHPSIRAVALVLMLGCAPHYPIPRAPLPERVPPAALPTVVKPPPGLRIHRAIRGPRQLRLVLRPADTTTSGDFTFPEGPLPQPLPPEMAGAYPDSLFLAVARDAWSHDASPHPARYIAVVAWLTPNNGRVMCLSARRAASGWFTAVSYDHCRRK